MISWTKLIAGKDGGNGDLRYGAAKTNSPKIVVWNVTPQCNLQCMHCYSNASRAKHGGLLDDREASDFIKDIADMGVKALIFSGGEPLLENRILKWGLEAGKIGLKVALSTNGTLIDEDIAEKIKVSGFSYVGISLDGDEGVNDLFRRSNGAFKRAVEGLRYCKNVGLKIGIRFTLTRRNKDEIDFIFDLAENEGIDRLCIYHLVYTGRGMDLMASDLTAKEKREALEIIWQKTLAFKENGVVQEVLTVGNHADGAWIYLKLKKEDPAMAQRCFNLLLSQGGNSSGIDLVAVGSEGSVYPDQFFTTHALGNIRKNRLSEIWDRSHSGLLGALRNRKCFLKGRCARCQFLSICNGNLRCRAESYYKDIWQEDPACYLSEEEIENL